VSEREVWRDPNGNPLKFQSGDYVRIETSSNPEAGSRLPFREGYVRGYSLSGVGGVYGAAYELFKMGDPPLRWVREGFLEKVPELIPHVHHGGFCGICGNGGRPEGLSIFAGPNV
jgi:hypothetical protein